MITSPQMSEVPRHTSRCSPTAFRWAGYWNAATQPSVGTIAMRPHGRTTTRPYDHTTPFPLASPAPAGGPHPLAGPAPLANGPLAAGRRYLGTSPYTHLL